MARRRGFKFVTKEDWQEMKDLFANGFNTEMVRKRTHRGGGTMKCVRESKSYEDYKRISRQYSQYYKARRDKKELSESKKDMNLLGGFDLPGYKETAIIIPKLTRKYTPRIKESENFSGTSSTNSLLILQKLTQMVGLLEQIEKNTKPPRRKFGFFW